MNEVRTQLNLFDHSEERVTQCSVCQRTIVVWRSTKLGGESEYRDELGRCFQCSETARK